jgi:hypothetical protein
VRILQLLRGALRFLSALLGQPGALLGRLAGFFLGVSRGGGGAGTVG